MNVPDCLRSTDAVRGATRWWRHEAGRSLRWFDVASGRPSLRGASRRRRRRLALAAALALTLGATVGCQRISPGASPAPPLPPLPDVLDGFRADAWFLPDDPLLGFVEVPAGPFTMGSDPAVDPQAFGNERWSADRAQGTLNLPAFLVGRYEVTVAQFRTFAAAAGATVDAAALGGPLDHPVATISWPDALAYCRWLDRTLREWPDTPPFLRERLDAGWRVTLPSEAQWEKAARGADGRIYPWGDSPRRDRANFGGAPGTTPAGSLDCPECPFGLGDMSGNVWELTRSPYQPYPYDESDDDADLESNALFVMRGGSFMDPPGNIRSAIRGGADPGARRPFIGFRAVITPPDERGPLDRHAGRPAPASPDGAGDIDGVVRPGGSQARGQRAGRRPPRAAAVRREAGRLKHRNGRTPDRRRFGGGGRASVTPGRCRSGRGRRGSVLIRTAPVRRPSGARAAPGRRAA